jgi:UPF0176 protein
MSVTVATFYYFFPFSQFHEARRVILNKMLSLDIKGSVLIAAEGINSTVAGSHEAINEFLHFLKTTIVKADFEHKESLCGAQPFGRAKVRLKKETISLGEVTALKNTGTYVDPHDWNALVNDPDTIVIDARNDYEVELGTFERAINPRTRSFKQLPAFARNLLKGNKNKKIAAFCTGGIRCEKFTSWLKGQGFENVYHLKGGILKYLEEIPPSQSKWRGECYVFDDRIALDHNLLPTRTARICRSCGRAIKYKERCCMSCNELISV